MNKNGPIVIIEDDEDDQEQLETIFGRLGYINELLFFADGEKRLPTSARKMSFHF